MIEFSYCCIFDTEICSCDFSLYKMTCLNPFNKVLNLGSLDSPRIKELIISNKIYNGTKNPFTYDAIVFVNTLKIQFNELSIVKAKWCPPFVNLTELWINSNKIEEIDSEAFVSLNQLRYLDLSFNKLVSIKSGTFQSLTNLVELNLAHNRIFEIENSLFESLFKLEKLNLKSNQLEAIDLNSFAHLKNIKVFVRKLKNICKKEKRNM